MTIIGTRPEITKLSALIPDLDQEFEHILVHTGQHYSYNMDKVFFEELQLRLPDYNLEIGSGSHGEQVGKGLIEFEKLLLKERPDLVLVYGDTNSTLMGALAASKLNIPVAHLEAGCRSFNRQMPEEVNRVVADACSSFLFPHDRVSYNNLKREGIQDERIFFLGRPIYEACLRTKVLAEMTGFYQKLNLEQRKYTIVTLHRAENTNNVERLRGIIKALNLIADDLAIVFPIHPRTKKILEENSIILSPKIQQLEPLGYLEFTNLLLNAKFVMTDSGGIQEETVIYNIPCLILREETEWSEFVDAGKNMLLTTSPEKILATTRNLLENPGQLQKMKDIHVEFEKDVNKKIIEVLKSKI